MGRPRVLTCSIKTPTGVRGGAKYFEEVTSEGYLRVASGSIFRYGPGPTHQNQARAIARAQPELS